jgi:predicted phosphodiesterase
MKVAIVADIHSNATAFKAALDDVGKVDMVWCVGDIVGYGPDPVECIDIIRAIPHICIAGNHDVCVAGGPDDGRFNQDALAACEWSRSKLDDDHKAFLLDLPLEAEPVQDVLLVHGAPGSSNTNDDTGTNYETPGNPDDIETNGASRTAKLWEYITSTWQAEEILSVTPFKLIFVGHTHVPLLFKKSENKEVEFLPLIAGESVKLDLVSNKYLINPGSVGQPRDGDARAGFMLFDTDSSVIEYRRVEYAVEEVLDRIRSGGLPLSLGKRLEKGL